MSDLQDTAYCDILFIHWATQSAGQPAGSGVCLFSLVFPDAGFLGSRWLCDAVPPGPLFTPSALEFAAACKGPGQQPGGQKALLYLAPSAPSVMRKGPRHHCPKKPSFETIWFMAGHRQASSRAERCITAWHCHT